MLLYIICLNLKFKLKILLANGALTNKDIGFIRLRCLNYNFRWLNNTTFFYPHVFSQQLNNAIRTTLSNGPIIVNRKLQNYS